MHHYRTFLYNKLCRTKTIERLEQIGSNMEYRILDAISFDSALRIKLQEETKEVILAKSKEALTNECADVLEVIEALARLHGISFDSIMTTKARIKEERGGYEERIFIGKVAHIIGGPGEKYCLKDPKKYPEVME